MNNIKFDSMGRGYKVYSTITGNREPHGYNISRQVAGEVVHDLAKAYMEQAKEKDYSRAVKEVLNKDPDLKRAYFEG